MGKWKLVVIPYLVDNELLELELSPPGVKGEQDRRPRWIGDSSYSSINFGSLPIAALSSIQ